MACFLVPAAEAVVTTAAGKILEKHEEKAAAEKTVSGAMHERFSVKLKRLSGLLWGGSGLLAFEHLWHGEIQPFFPFLTAAEDPESLAGVFHEMSTVGVGMAVVVTAAWAVWTLCLNALDKKAAEEALAAAEVPVETEEAASVRE